MSFWLQVWLGVCAGAFVLALSLRWIVGPIRLHKRYFAAARLTLHPVADAELSPEMREFYLRFFSQARSLGFGGGGVWSLGETAASGATTVLAAPTNDTAQAVSVLVGTARNNVLSIRSRFWDGSAVLTSNTATLHGHKQNPRHNHAAFAWVTDIATLVEAHARRLNALQKADTRRIDAPRPGDEPAYIQRGWIEEFDWQVTSGYLYLDAANARYRATWKGATLMSWTLTQPVKRWLLARRERKMRALWRSLGMDDYTPPAQAEPVPDQDDAAVETSSLGYEAGLAEGELRQERQGRTLIVRMGGPTAQTMIRSLVPKIVFAIVGGFAFVAAVADNWLLWHRMANLPMSARWHQMPGSSLSLLSFAIVWLLFLAMDIRRIIRDVRQVRETVVLSASHAGISFTNTPGVRPEGALRRDEIEGLFVRTHRLGFAGRRYRLDARLFDGGRRVMLLVGKDRAVLDQARVALFDAMGMAVPAASAVKAAAE